MGRGERRGGRREWEEREEVGERGGGEEGERKKGGRRLHAYTLLRLLEASEIRTSLYSRHVAVVPRCPH